MQILILAFLLLAWPALAAENQKEKASPVEKVEELSDAPPLTTGAGVRKDKVSEELTDDAAQAHMLVVGVRTDVAFVGGRPVEQGFSVPGVRLNVSGQLGSYFDYRLSLAPTREFSTALLPQILPAEAWIQASAAGDWEPMLRARVGLFAPALNPLFDRDLGELPIADYGRVHQELLLFREIGGEVGWRVLPDRLDVTVGYFNGNGILASNTNNARAYMAGAVAHAGVLRGKLDLGVSGYSLSQAEPGSVNYVNRAIADAYAVWRRGRTWLVLDVISGKVEDNVRTMSVFGFTGVAYVGLWRWLSLYLRGEALRYSPVLEPNLNRIQLGPAFDPVRGLRAFFYFEHVDAGGGVGENSGQVLVRIQL